MFGRHFVKYFAALPLMIGAIGHADAAGDCIQCYKKVVTPAQYQTITETRLLEPERVAYKVTPPVYDHVTEQVMVSPEQVTYSVTPAKYKVSWEKVLVHEGSVYYKKIPPRYTTVSEQVMVSPETTAWVERYGYRCEIRIRAKYKTVYRKEMVSGPSEVAVTTPPVYANKQVSVKVSEEARIEHRTPAVYKVVTKTVVVSPATKTAYTIPARYGEYQKTVQTSAATTSWAPVDCPTCGHSGAGYGHHHHHPGYGHHPSHHRPAKPQGY
jgi:hypothetical protein